MGRTPRERFRSEKARVDALDDGPVRAALLGFAAALDPADAHADLPRIDGGRFDGYADGRSHSTAKNYLSALRCAHARGLDLLGADAETVNRFVADLATDPAERTHDLVDYEGHIGKPTAKSWQSALRAFYRWATDPNTNGQRPETAVGWSDVDGSKAIRMFSATSEPRHRGDDAADPPGDDELAAIRESCLHSQNTRRDRAFVELAAGTAQRVYALVTLRVTHVRLDDDDPHILLNPEIAGDGDKGAIETAGRWRPIVSDAGPIREWLAHHPLRDEETRDEVGAPDDFQDCYAFVGSLGQRSTDAASHWGAEAARNMLERRARKTADLPTVATVDLADTAVNPHAWRHWAYDRAKAVPDLDATDRRAVFGWAPGSDAGERTYGDEADDRAGKRFARAWADHYGDGEAPSVVDQIAGPAAASDLSDEAVGRLVSRLIANEEFREFVDAAVREQGE